MKFYPDAVVFFGQNYRGLISARELSQVCYNWSSGVRALPMVAGSSEYNLEYNLTEPEYNLTEHVTAVAKTP